MYIQSGNNTNTQKLLRYAFDEAVCTLGLSAARTIMWHLRIRGAVSQKYGTFDIDRLYSGLQEILGSGTEMIMERIYRCFSRNYTMNAILAFERQHPSKSYLEKIHLLVQEMEAEVEN